MRTNKELLNGIGYSLEVMHDEVKLLERQVDEASVMEDEKRDEITNYYRQQLADSRLREETYFAIALISISLSVSYGFSIFLIS